MHWRVWGGAVSEGRARLWPTWRVVAVVAVAYATGAMVAFVAFGATAIVVLFLPAGVTLSALVLTPVRQWPWILATVAVIEIAVDLAHGQSLSFVWGFALANTAEPLIGASLLRRRFPGGVDLLRRRDLVAFLVCGVLAGPAVGALIGATTIRLGLHRGWFESFLPFWAGDATGALVVGGCVLAWRHRPLWDPASAGRWAMSVAAAVLVTAAGFWPAHLPLFYLPIPLLFWLAFGQRLMVVLSSALGMTIAANVLTSAGHGPWAALEGPVALKTATLQLFLGVTILGAWFLAVGVAERDKARRATSAERAARQRLHVVQQLTARLATAATSPAIAEAVVRDGAALFADHAALGIVTPGAQDVVTWSAIGRPPDGLEPVPHSETPPLAYAARADRSVVFQHIDELTTSFPRAAREYGAAGLRSGLCLPVGDRRGPPLGALSLAFRREQAVDPDTVATAETLASIVGQALRRAQRYEHERDAAHRLQHALMPVIAGNWPGIGVTTAYRPAESTNDVGGDWYDVFALPDGRVGLVVGDVVGHDLAAAAAMARIQSALRILAQSAGGPARVLAALDRAGALITNSFMATVGYADYHPGTGLLRYACAGHPPPLLVTEGRARFLWGGRSVPVGVTGVSRLEAQCAVPAGSTLIWYTDGLVEREDEPLTTGLDRLAAAANASQNQDDLCGALLQSMSPEDTLRDDAVVLCVRFAPIVTRAGEVGAGSSADPERMMR